MRSPQQNMILYSAKNEKIETPTGSDKVKRSPIKLLLCANISDGKFSIRSASSLGEAFPIIYAAKVKKITPTIDGN